MARRGKLSRAWPRFYAPQAPQQFFRLKRRVNFVPLSGFVDRDLMCDYIEEGAEWWIARSELSINQIIRVFDKGDAACCLYERTGAMLPLGHDNRWHLIAIQLVTNGNDWDLDITLEELGVYLEELWDGMEVSIDTYLLHGQSANQ